MTERYDSEKITPENVEEKIQSYLKEARVGSVALRAFRDRLDWRRAYWDIRETEFILEILDGSESSRHIGTDVVDQIREVYGRSRVERESGLRQDETKIAMVELEIGRQSCTVPGYLQASFYSDVLISKLEDMCIKECNWEMIKGPHMKEYRSISEAHDIADQYVTEIEMADKRTVGQWVISLIRSL